MKLDDIETVTGLRNHRALALRLRAAAHEGSLGDFHIWHAGERNDVFSIISAEPIRSAIIVAGEDFLADIDKKLSAFGVRVEKPFKEAERDVDGWRRAAEMYARAWLRELGGRLIPKTHFIDALCLTTQRLRDRAEKNQSADGKSIAA